MVIAWSILYSQNEPTWTAWDVEILLRSSLLDSVNSAVDIRTNTRIGRVKGKGNSSCSSPSHYVRTCNHLTVIIEHKSRLSNGLTGSCRWDDGCDAEQSSCQPGPNRDWNWLSQRYFPLPDEACAVALPTHDYMYTKYDLWHFRASCVSNFTDIICCFGRGNEVVCTYVCRWLAFEDSNTLPWNTPWTSSVL